MNKYLLLILFLSINNAFAQSSFNTKGTTPKTEVLKGSQQNMMSECGLGKTSIKQTITSIFGTKVKKAGYKIRTVLWFQFTDIKGSSCYGAWGYDLLEIVEDKYSLPDAEKEKRRQAKKAFDLLYHLQRQGNH